MRGRVWRVVVGVAYGIVLAGLMREWSRRSRRRGPRASGDALAEVDRVMAGAGVVSERLLEEIEAARVRALTGALGELERRRRDGEG